MPEVCRGEEGVEAAARAALEGRLVVLPTDTVYGIGTRPDRPEATARLFETKGRPRELELPVLVPSPEAAEEVGVLDDRARRLVDAFWPGPLTVVVGRTERSRPWELGGDPSTIGLRVPDHAVAMAVLAATGPLAVTSANLSGRPTPTTCEELVELFGEAVAVYVCAGEPPVGIPSTVVDVAHGPPRVLRAGTVPGEAVLAVLGRAEGRC